MFVIRPAKESEHQELTSISFESKGYWNYPKSYFDVWENELTINHEYIRTNTVFVYEINGVVLGYYSIVELKENIEICVAEGEQELAQLVLQSSLDKWSLLQAS